LFGPRGACGGCWCMSWLVPKKEFRAGCAEGGKGNKAAFKKRVKTGPPPGLIAYHGKTPVGWIAAGPREGYVRLAASRILQPVDETPVWSAPCFFVAKEHRGKGLSVELLKAAAEFAQANGAPALEGYPSDIDKPLPAPFVYTGLASGFKKAGFKEVVRRSKSRPIMRRKLK